LTLRGTFLLNSDVCLCLSLFDWLMTKLEWLLFTFARLGWRFNMEYKNFLTKYNSVLNVSGYRRFSHHLIEVIPLIPPIPWYGTTPGSARI
jgi:hypothetical protein